MKWLLLLALSGCAPLNTLGMSEHCRRLYDACLNGCPRPPAGTQSSALQFEIAACTRACNERACH